MFDEIDYYSKSLRDQVGNAHFLKQLEREYDFPVEVFRLTVDGGRELVRVEH